MSNSLTFGEKTLKKLSPKEKVQYSILGNRLGLTDENARLTLESIHKDTARIFSIPESSVTSEIDFSGRDFDLVFTISKQNTPSSKA
ncbi:MAG: hypothetical protein IKP71_12190 [Candidatus Riflebacteria bacterium]|nr:hypothetical protein [Candidatus Riflebacteria bacterium]